MNYAVEMGSGAMIYIRSFKNICLPIQKLEGGDTDNKHTHRRQCYRISQVLFFQNKRYMLTTLNPQKLQRQVSSEICYRAVKLSHKAPNCKIYRSIYCDMSL
jgi:hypothetical protein